MQQRATNQAAGPLDVHTHFFPRELPDLAARTGDARWPSLSVREGEGRIMQGDRTFRVVAPECWDVDARVRAMDARGIDVHVQSPVPITLTYWADREVAAEHCRIQNDLLAAAVAVHPDRLRAFATVPLPAVDAAIAELERAVTELQFCGVEIGAQIAGMELDNARLRPFFATAAALDVPVFVHPLDGGSGAIRRGGPLYDFGLGMLTDTAMAAGALVFGGVLAELPDLRVCLAHGCGTFPWALPRLARAASREPEGPRPERAASLARLLWCDSLVFEPSHLAVLVERFGEDHVALGSDFPFYPPAWGTCTDVLDGAVAAELCSPQQAAAIARDNGVRLLGPKFIPTETRSRRG